MECNRGHKVRFTKHAREKFEALKRYGFEISEEEVIRTIRDPARVDKRGFSALCHQSHKRRARFKGRLRRGKRSSASYNLIQ